MVKRGNFKTEEFTLALFLLVFLLFILNSPDEVLTGITNSLTGYVVSDLSGANESGFLAKGKSYLSQNYLAVSAVFLSFLLLVFLVIGVRSLVHSGKVRRNKFLEPVTTPPQPRSDKSVPAIKKWRSKKDLPLLKELSAVNKELSFLSDVEEERGRKIENLIRKERMPVAALPIEDKKPKKVILASSHQSYNNELDYVNKELASLGVIDEPVRLIKEAPPLMQKKTNVPGKVISKYEKPILTEPERKLELKVREEFVKRKMAAKEEKRSDKEIFAKKYSSSREALDDADKISQEINALVRDYFA